MIPLVLTDSEFKSTHAYQFLKEVAKEIQYSVENGYGDIESQTNLNHCKESLSNLLNSYMQDGVKKTDKVTKA